MSWFEPIDELHATEDATTDDSGTEDTGTEIAPGVTIERRRILKLSGHSSLVVEQVGFWGSSLLSQEERSTTSP